MLEKNDDKDGIIGLRAGTALKQVPSMSYWSGLERWGIRRRRGTREQWSRSHQYDRATDDGERLESVSWWHDNLVDPPSDFPYEASLEMSAGEAEYLAERITTSCPPRPHMKSEWSNLPVSISTAERPPVSLSQSASRWCDEPCLST